jgi:arylformamidase
MFYTKFPKLRLFGFDMISLTSKLDRPEGKEAHLNFLIENQILILEDMNLENLFTCPNKVIVAPLQIENSDGGPCTVFAFF